MPVPADDNFTHTLRLGYSSDAKLNRNWEIIDDMVRRILDSGGGGDNHFTNLFVDNLFATNIQVDNLTVNNNANFHGTVVFDGPSVTFVNNVFFLGNVDMENLFVRNLTFKPGGTFNTPNGPVVGNEDIISIDWSKITNKPPGFDTGHALPIGPAGGDLTDFYPDPHLVPTGVVAGVYGDATNTPRISVDAKGRLTNVTLVPITGGGGGSPPVGQAGGDLTGTYPDPSLVAITTAGTWGSESAIPIITIDAKGRVIHLDQTTVTPDADQMDAVFEEKPKWGYLFPNTTDNVHTMLFTPRATGKGRYTGSIHGSLLNTKTDPAPGVMHICWVTAYFYLDGVQVHKVQRFLEPFEPGIGGGNNTRSGLEIPFDFPWAAAVDTSHQLIVQLRNFRNETESVDVDYPMSYYVDYSSCLIEEERGPRLVTRAAPPASDLWTDQGAFLQPTDVLNKVRIGSTLVPPIASGPGRFDPPVDSASHYLQVWNPDGPCTISILGSINASPTTPPPPTDPGINGIRMSPMYVQASPGASNGEWWFGGDMGSGRLTSLFRHPSGGSFDRRALEITSDGDAYLGCNEDYTGTSSLGNCRIQSHMGRPSSSDGTPQGDGTTSQINLGDNYVRKLHQTAGGAAARILRVYGGGLIARAAGQCTITVAWANKTMLSWASGAVAWATAVYTFEVEVTQGQSSDANGCWVATFTLTPTPATAPALSVAATTYTNRGAYSGMAPLGGDSNYYVWRARGAFDTANAGNTMTKDVFGTELY